MPPLPDADLRPDATVAAQAYMPELDGLRAVSVGLVVLSHFGLRFVPGLLGVTVFFFISGFLITGHLLAELDRTGTIGLPAFFARRVLRLYPALTVAVACGTALVLAAGGTVAARDVAAALFYAVNLREYAVLLPEPLPGVPHPFSVLWSLAVEEHFYLLFPFAVLALARRRTAFVAALVGTILVVTAWRIHVAGVCAASGCTFLRVEHGTDTRLDSILYGALLATAGPAVLRAARGRAALTGAALLLAGSVLLRDPWFRDTLRFSVQGVALFGLVAALRGAGRARRMLSHPALAGLGRWSYSLYLWHWLVLVAVLAWAPPAITGPLTAGNGVPPAWWLVTVLPALAGTSVLAASASYHAVERPFLRLRRAWGSNAAG